MPQFPCVRVHVEMWKEAEARNEQMSEADKSKNLHWLVVGARGEKRLIKSIRREQEGGREERRGEEDGGEACPEEG